MTLVVDYTVVCPSCWEPHVVTIDMTDEARTLIEDCHVCCHPMQIRFDIIAGEPGAVTVEAL